MKNSLLLSLVIGAVVSAPAYGQDAQTSTSTTQQDTTYSDSATSAQQDKTGVTPMDKTPTYRVNVVERTTPAVNYRHRAGSTNVDFRGTSLMPNAKGEAKVNSQKGRLEINTKFDGLKSARSLGPEYLTYVLWAITPEGRPVNLGEVIPDDDGEVSMRVTSDLQAFGLIVTAEPYFAVTRPSNMIVLENQVRKDTKGWEQPILARFDLLERGEYTIDLDPTRLPATTAINDKNQKNVPLELLEARNAIAIAEAAGAGEHAPDALARARDFLSKGEDYLQRDQSKSAIGTVARGAVQAAEDARILTVRRKREQQLAQERREAAERTQQAQLQAQQEQERARLAQQQADEESRRRATAEEERLAAQQASEEARKAAELAAQERAAAEQARQAALQQQQQLQAQAQQAQQQAEQARLAAQRAEQEREQMRQRLLTQLNQVLQTKDSARGLIVNMSDVLFDTGKATLRPGAKMRLAKVAGIILAYPDLRLQIEGHTDSVGSDDYNMTLSQRRAATVRDFLVSQGVNLNNITAQGYGESQPVASNSNSAGRQQNRRVDLVVNGEAIQSASAGRMTPGANQQAGGTAGVSGAATNNGGAVGAGTNSGASVGAGANVGAGTSVGGNANPAGATPSGVSSPANSNSSVSTSGTGASTGAGVSGNVGASTSGVGASGNVGATTAKPDTSTPGVGASGSAGTTTGTGVSGTAGATGQTSTPSSTGTSQQGTQTPPQ